MYDASLDKIWNRKQNFSIYYNQIIPYSNWMSGYFGNNSFNYWWNHKYLKVPAMEFDHFVTQGTMSMDQALNGMVPGVMVRRIWCAKAGLNDGQYDDTGRFEK